MRRKKEMGAFSLKNEGWTGLKKGGYTPRPRASMLRQLDFTKQGPCGCWFEGEVCGGFDGATSAAGEGALGGALEWELRE